MKNIIFSIFIDIPEDKLDNPGWYENGIQVKTDKSLQTKNALKDNKWKIIEKQQAYAKSINSDYLCIDSPEIYNEWAEQFRNLYPEISEYDIINFYKHHCMREYANEYDAVCYIDFDVIPNTDESIFEAHNIDTKFGCAHSNDRAVWGKTVSSEEYNTCIRNPATKYWNAHAMLLEEGYEPENDVFNTGIMVASSKVIKQLDYFKDFRENLNLMTHLKTDEDSMYPHNIQRVFGYDNETLFSYIVTSREIQIQYLDKKWHYIVDEKFDGPKRLDPSAKMYHFINKKMEWVL